MAKTQKKFLASSVTLERIKDLVLWRGENQTEVFTEAIRLLWEQENRKHNPQKCGECGTEMSWYPHLNAYVQQCDCD